MVNAIFLGLSIGAFLTSIVHLVCWPFVDCTITGPSPGLVLNLGDMALLWFLVSICAWIESGIKFVRWGSRIHSRAVATYLATTGRFPIFHCEVCRYCPRIHGCIIVFRKLFTWELQ